MSDLHFINGPWPGRLATMARPRGGDWLDDEISRLRRAGITALVSLLEPEEAAELNLENEQQICGANGIDYHSMPVPDRGVPSSRDAFDDLARTLLHALAAARTIAIHCRAGIGRSSLLAARILIEAGVAANEAWARISKARGLEGPDTREQRHWLEGDLRRVGPSVGDRR